MKPLSVIKHGKMPEIEIKQQAMKVLVLFSLLLYILRLTPQDGPSWTKKLPPDHHNWFK